MYDQIKILGFKSEFYEKEEIEKWISEVEKWKGREVKIKNRNCKLEAPALVHLTPGYRPTKRVNVKAQIPQKAKVHW